MNHRTAVRLLCGVALLAPLGGCQDFNITNKPPVANIRVLVGGVEVDPKDPIAYSGTPLTVTLDSTPSTDADGRIVAVRWLRTDVSAAQRYSPDGFEDGGTAPQFVGDPPATGTADVTLIEGTYRYSLWVFDNDRAASKPASVKLVVKTPSMYMPDATCTAAYANPVADCNDCVCTPNAMNGCLEDFQACENNPDPTFAMLCKALVDCAVAVKCMGAACYTAGGCMAQIDAAAGYMGGDLSKCSDMATPASGNPCRAATLLGACSGGTADMPGACFNACN